MGLQMAARLLAQRTGRALLARNIIISVSGIHFC
jgi:hypothetical protein